MSTKIKRGIIKIFCIIMPILFCGIVVVCAQQYEGNNAKTERENIGWEENIDLWGEVVNQWASNRDDVHNRTYQLDVDDRREYCNKRGCWSEDMFELSFVSAEGSKESWSIYKEHAGGEMTDIKGDTWVNNNSGQVLTYEGVDGEYWESANRGQSIDYINARGDRWESSNTGQVLLFTGIDGKHWESVNDGQVMEYKDGQGAEWESSNYGQSESYKDDEDEWEGSFD